jgi:hypothetical protein
MLYTYREINQSLSYWREIRPAHGANYLDFARLVLVNFCQRNPHFCHEL